MPLSEKELARRELMAARHSPPLYTALEAAKVLGRSVQAVMNLAKKLDWEVHNLREPFHRSNCYARADVLAAKVVLDEHGGRWPSSQTSRNGLSTSELRKGEHDRTVARLEANLRDFAQRSPSFASFSQAEQQAFVADMVDRHRPTTHPRKSKHDYEQFALAIRRVVSPAQQARVGRCVRLYYDTTTNFSYLNPTVAVRVVAELLSTAGKPTKDKR